MKPFVGVCLSAAAVVYVCWAEECKSAAVSAGISPPPRRLRSFVLWKQNYQ